MLVVRRRVGEVIRIGDQVELRLLSVGKTSVRLGIEAPRSIAITMRQPEPETSENNGGNGRYDEMSGEV
jgi:carbon storage regulator